LPSGNDKSRDDLIVQIPDAYPQRIVALRTVGLLPVEGLRYVFAQPTSRAAHFPAGGLPLSCFIGQDKKVEEDL
jgi:hypothetical protein